MKYVRLPLHGRKASRSRLAVLVDVADLPRVAQHRWFIDHSGYAVANIGKKQVRLHRYILNAKPDQLTDHRNLIKLDCRRKNLRVATAAENARNMPKFPGCTSRYKGVSLRRKTRKWVVYICVERRNIYLGQYSSETEAAKVYDRACRQHYGQFAHTNFRGAA